MSEWSDYRYRAFISYSHADEKWARWLHRSLETYRVPKHLVDEPSRLGRVPARLSPVFRDRDELASSTDLGSTLNAALADSACQIVICSPASARSHWVNEEVKAFKRLGRADRVFCFIVDGEPYASGMAGREAEECFPVAVRFQLDTDGEVSELPAEPIAADARPGKDGKANARLKLFAGLLGVGFDALRQRELQRRHRRMAFISTASAIGMFAAIGLATTAIIARDEADRQRVLAEREAETARRITSFMVGLFFVSDPSEARGRTITAREVLTDGAARINTELDGEPAVQTRLMDTIGSVFTNLGLYADARDMLSKALDKRRKMAGIDNAELVQSLLGLARIQTLQADLESAEKLYLEALELSGNGDGRDGALADIWAGLAELYFRMGRYAEAQPLLERVLAERRARLGDNHPNVADAIEELGLNQFDQGNFESAERYLREALTLRHQILGDAPHPAIAENLNNLALLLMESERFDDSEALYREAMAINQKLYGEVHPDVATGLNNLGRLYRVQGELGKAEQVYGEALEMKRTLLGPNHPDVAQVMTNLAFIYYDEGKLEQAIQLNQDALNIMEATLGSDHPEVASGLSTEARWLGEAGRLDEAEPLFRRALELLNAALPDDHPDIAIAETGLANLLTRANRELPEALEHAENATLHLAAAYGEDHWITGLAQSIQGGVLAALGRTDEAEQRLLGGYQHMVDNGNARPVYLRAALQRLSDFYDSLGRRQEAEHYRRLIPKA